MQREYCENYISYTDSKMKIDESFPFFAYIIIILKALGQGWGNFCQITDKDSVFDVTLSVYPHRAS
jgi:hypothetical protein